MKKFYAMLIAVADGLYRFSGVTVAGDVVKEVK